jgi:hypothetical protein
MDEDGSLRSSGAPDVFGTDATVVQVTGKLILTFFRKN